MKITITQNGKKMGPFSKDEVESMIRSGLLNYDIMACNDNETNWQPLKKIIASRVDASTADNDKIAKNNPIFEYFMPRGRIGRISWLLRNITNIMLYSFLCIPAAEFIEGPLHFIAELYFILLFLAYVYVSLVTCSKRLHDLNISGWFSIGVFIPLVPLLLLILSGTKGPNKYGNSSD